MKTMKVLYNPDCPELVFAAASIAFKILENIGDDSFRFIPVRARDLNKNITSIEDQLNEELEKIGERECLGNGASDTGSLEYFLLGIYPKDREDEMEIATFFDENINRIKLWVDGHCWPENLLKFMRSEPKSVFIDAEKTSLQILSEIGYITSKEWLSIEGAMINSNLDDKLASRYLGAIAVSRLAINSRLVDGYRFAAFVRIIEEILSGREDTSISLWEKKFYDATESTNMVMDLFRDDYSLFEKAKSMGRPVGYFYLSRGMEFLDVERLMEHGIKEYPWLVVLEIKTDEEMPLRFRSKKIDISKVLRGYSNVDFTNEDILGILNVEVVRYKEKEVST